MGYLSLPIHSDGPIIDVQVAVPVSLQKKLQDAGRPVPSPITARAILDTGSGPTLIDNEIVEKLALKPIGPSTIHTVTTGGVPSEGFSYVVNILIPTTGGGMGALNFESIEVAGRDLRSQGVGVLFGRNVLSNFLFVYDGRSEKFSVAW